MKKLAIIGASRFQDPLIRRAKEMGLQTHVFAWKTGDIGEKTADFFYPISITEKEKILKKCIEIGIDGICTIASDLAIISVNYVAKNMGLIGNSEECVRLTTNKHFMRNAFKKNNDPSVKSFLVEKVEDVGGINIGYPVIVKPTDRSGSRGITKAYSGEEIREAVITAINQSFEKKVLIEEFVEGEEYSVECISLSGKHHFLALTKKYTTGPPKFIETGHLEPVFAAEDRLKKIKKVIFHALNSLKIKNGASHSEIKIDNNGNIKIIEIGARMGGDYIGSHLVQIATGFDFLKSVILISLGIPPDIELLDNKSVALVRFVLTDEDVEIFEKIQEEHPEFIVFNDFEKPKGREINDSSTRYGAYIVKASSVKEIEMYLPKTKVGEY